MSKTRPRHPSTPKPPAPKATGTKSRRPRAPLLITGLGLAVLVAAAVVVFGPGRQLLRPAGAAGPNVVLITLDTTRADHLGCYGDTQARTPNLDRLAAEGVRFARVYAPAPLTLPSHTSILTGLYPATHGVRNNGHDLDPKLRTLKRTHPMPSIKVCIDSLGDVSERLSEGY